MGEHLHNNSLHIELQRLSGAAGVELLPDYEALDVNLTYPEWKVRHPVRGQLIDAMQPEGNEDEDRIASLQSDVINLNRVCEYIQDQSSIKRPVDVSSLYFLKLTEQAMEEGKSPINVHDGMPNGDWFRLSEVAHKTGTRWRSIYFQAAYERMLASNGDNVTIVRTDKKLEAVINSDGIQVMRSYFSEVALEASPPDHVSVHGMVVALGVNDEAIEARLHHYENQGSLIKANLGLFKVVYPIEIMQLIKSAIPEATSDAYYTAHRIVRELKDATGIDFDSRVEILFKDAVAQNAHSLSEAEDGEAQGAPLVVYERAKRSGSHLTQVHEHLARMIKTKIMYELESRPMARENHLLRFGISKLVQDLDPRHRLRRRQVDIILDKFEQLDFSKFFIGEYRYDSSRLDTKRFYHPAVVRDVLYLMGVETVPDMLPSNLKDIAGKGYGAAAEYFNERYITALERPLRGGRITIIDNGDGKPSAAYIPPSQAQMSEGSVSLLPVMRTVSKEGQARIETLDISSRQPPEFFTLPGDGHRRDNLGASNREYLAQSILAQAGLEKDLRDLGEFIFNRQVREYTPQIAIFHSKVAADIRYILHSPHPEAIFVLNVLDRQNVTDVRLLDIGERALERFSWRFGANAVQHVVQDKSAISVIANRPKLLVVNGVEAVGTESLLIVRPRLATDAEFHLRHREPFSIFLQSLSGILRDACQDMNIPPEGAESILRQISQLPTD